MSFSLGNIGFSFGAKSNNFGLGTGLIVRFALPWRLRTVIRRNGATDGSNPTGIGHKTKLPVACFGETVLWRQRRNIAELGKHDVEYTEGVFLGISGMSTKFLVGTPRECSEHEMYEHYRTPQPDGIANAS